MGTKLDENLASRYLDRKGGNTRVLKAGVRYSDSAPTAVIELVDRDENAKGGGGLNAPIQEAQEETAHQRGEGRRRRRRRTRRRRRKNIRKRRRRRRRRMNITTLTKTPGKHTHDAEEHDDETEGYEYDNDD